MKKFFSVFLSILMVLSFNMTAFANYRDPVDGIKMKAGLNPVIMQIDDTHFQYAVYAVDMEKLTNADLIIKYSDNVVVESFEATDTFDIFCGYDKGTQLNVSFVYKTNCQKANVKLFVVNFEYSGEISYPELEISILAGTFIKKINAPVTVEYDGKNELSEKKTLGDVDINGTVNAADARLALRFSAKLENLNESQQKNADVNRDGNITSADARMILRVSAGLENGFSDEY